MFIHQLFWEGKDLLCFFVRTALLQALPLQVALLQLLEPIVGTPCPLQEDLAGMWSVQED